MAIAVHDSIILLIGIILILYGLLLLNKMGALYKSKREKNYYREAIYFLDSIIEKLEERQANSLEIKRAKELIKNRYQRNIITERIILYLSIYSGKIVENISSLCIKSGLLKYHFDDLKVKKHHIKVLACKNLGDFRNKSACCELIKALRSNHKDVRYHALLALAKIGDADSFVKGFNLISKKLDFSQRALIEIVDSFEGSKIKLYRKMMSHPDPGVAAIFISSAGNYMDISLSKEICMYINDEDKEKRIAAIKAMGKNGDIRYIGYVERSLEDDQWEVRAAAAKTLGSIQDPSSLDKLIRILSDREWWVRYNAANSIMSMKDGIRILKEILSGHDKFAKDSIIAAMENVGVFQEIWMYEYSRDKDKRELFNLLSGHLKREESR